MQMVRELVTDPQAFFKGKAQDRSVVLELFVVLVVGALGSIGSYYFAQRVFALADTGAYSNFQAMGLVLEPLFGVILFWIGGALTCHFASTFYNGRGPMRRLLKLSAWAMVPIAVGNVVRSVVIYLTYSGMTAEDVDFGFAGEFDEQATILREASSNDALLVVAMLVLILSVVAAWHLLSYAVANAKSLDLDDARKVAAIPSGLFVLYLLRALLIGLGVL